MTSTKHPAAFNDRLIDKIREMLLSGTPLPDGATIFDPFCGIGKVADLGPQWNYVGCEIEPEWSTQAARRGVFVLGGEMMLSFRGWMGEFGAIVTSPTYGNRLADQYAPDMGNPKHRARRTYRLALGRPLTSGNTGALPWGEKYREVHEAAWKRCVDLLKPGGKFVLNIKNHVRGGVEQKVSEWHVACLQELGLRLKDTEKVPLKGDQNTATMRKKGLNLVDFEWLCLFEK